MTEKERGNIQQLDTTPTFARVTEVGLRADYRYVSLEPPLNLQAAKPTQGQARKDKSYNTPLLFPGRSRGREAHLQDRPYKTSLL